MLRRRLMQKKADENIVDLGLSVLWASGNICKNDSSYYVGEPTDYGCYYSWGNILGHNSGDGYNWGNSVDSNYVVTPGYSVSANIASNDSAHDAALACLGTGYRMPTKAEYQELYDNCTCTWVTSYNGVAVAGRVFKSNKAGYTNAKIFFPAAGLGTGTNYAAVGTQGRYWTSSYMDEEAAYSLIFQRNTLLTQNGSDRYYGCTVRAVQSK